MSNYLAIATVTAVLQRTILDSLQYDVPGARVTTLKPLNLGTGPADLGVNIFLYQAVSNPALNNIDSAPMRSRGNPTKRQAAVDLYYIVSCYGNDVELQPQLLLGSVLRSLNDRSVINSEIIQQTLADSSYSFLRDSNLADQLQQINVSLYDLNLDDFSKVWSTFFQTPYVLSVVYKVLVVLIEGQESPPRALPVRRSGIGGAVPFSHHPIVEQVTAQTGNIDPILANSTLRIRGKNLKNDRTRVRIGEIDIPPTEVTQEQLLVSLNTVSPESLRCGVQNLQVVYYLTTGTDATAQLKSIESNVFPFVLRPTISLDVTVSNLQENDDGSRSARLNLTVDLIVGTRQRVVLALNQITPENPASYLFDAAKRESDSHLITVPVDRIKPGDYLVRLMVDGAESQLNIDTNADSPTFNYYISPQVTI